MACYHFYVDRAWITCILCCIHVFRNSCGLDDLILQKSIIIMVANKSKVNAAIILCLNPWSFKTSTRVFQHVIIFMPIDFGLFAYHIWIMSFEIHVRCVFLHGLDDLILQKSTTLSFLISKQRYAQIHDHSRRLLEHCSILSFEIRLFMWFGWFNLAIHVAWMIWFCKNPYGG